MTLLPSDEPQTMQPSADLAGEAQTERCSSEDAQGTADATTNATDEIVDPSPADPSTHSPSFEEPPLFANVFHPEPPPPPVRIPNLGHFLLLLPCIGIGIAATGFLEGIGTHFHFFTVPSSNDSLSDIGYGLGLQAALYLLALVPALLVFPLLWHKSFFDGVQWNGLTALHLRWRLIGTGFLCFVIGIVNIILFPGPKDAPIEKVFKQPGAAWLLFAFGVTFAPFFEEMFYRGFLLPSLCTAYDWLTEKYYNVPRRPLTANGHPQWSLSAMAIASVVTSIPFALMHAHQTGDSVSVGILLGCVSLVLCTVRLVTRSLASSVLVHSFYNFLLFSIMLLGTNGFQHLDKM
jgi:membrane protease YdiL (CAAX protease family)